MSKTLLPHQERVVKERDELLEKEEKLGAFLHTNTFNDLPSAERSRLLRQFEVMKQYEAILNSRIMAFTGHEEERFSSRWKVYRKTKTAEMRPYELGEDLTGISVGPADRSLTTFLGGMIARDSLNHNDQWYINEVFFKENYEEVKN